MVDYLKKALIYGHTSRISSICTLWLAGQISLVGKNPKSSKIPRMSHNATRDSFTKVMQKFFSAIYENGINFSRPLDN